MLIAKAGNDNAIILLHEIYGINDYIKKMCDIYHGAGFDIFCPDLLMRDTYFLYEQHEQAYNYFMSNCGFNTTAVEKLVNELKEKYKKSSLSDLVSERLSPGFVLKRANAVGKRGLSAQNRRCPPALKDGVLRHIW